MNNVPYNFNRVRLQSDIEGILNDYFAMACDSHINPDDRLKSLCRYEGALRLARELGFDVNRSHTGGHYVKLTPKCRFYRFFFPGE